MDNVEGYIRSRLAELETRSAQFREMARAQCGSRAEHDNLWNSIDTVANRIDELKRVLRKMSD